MNFSVSERPFEVLRVVSWLGNHMNAVSRRDKVLRGLTGRENVTRQQSQDCAALHPGLFSTSPYGREAADGPSHAAKRAKLDNRGHSRDCPPPIDTPAASITSEI